ncbi:MAG TPA: hypothetical protein VH917_04740, partial [Ignavibacteriaceae bacterium]
KDDSEWLPQSEKEWNTERIDKKYFNLARVIRSMNNNHGPDLLGVCEVENKMVLDSLTIKFLSDLDFKVAHLESPDNRGIDNALIYRSNKFKLLNVQADTVLLADNYPTRLIFGANLLTTANEKVTVFVNHWPSRRGGEQSVESRIIAAKTLNKSVDKILQNEPNSKIIIIGDFNDNPNDVSILEHLKAEPIICDSVTDINLQIDVQSNLFNLSYESYGKGIGSYKYKEDWNMLDQIIVSRDLILNENFSYICNSFEVYKPNFIVTKSGNYKGAPFPTYGGSRYLGGYSDHYPVLAKFKIVNWK